MTDDALEPIAIVGAAGRFPGAATLGELWANLKAGVVSMSRFGTDELVASGVDQETAADPDYLGVSGYVDGADRFDAGFFGFSPREAALLDPQHRLFLECAWEALEDAGCDPDRFDGAIGVYAGAFMNKYLPLNLYTNQRFMKSPEAYFARNYNDKDFLAGRAAYLFNLRGPAVTVQTACSTSLVATHLACQALLNYDCDLALVGGVAVNVPLKSGYPRMDGGLFSPTGECRPFDARAGGTVPGYGSAVVALRRLGDAARDDVRAVILGTAINNDGSGKVSFTAPNASAQAEVIAAAQAIAAVEPDSIGYVEAHGTGTPLGDPIEVTALTEVFRSATDRTGFCALGAVKANIGHLDAAAGVAGLLRATLAVQHGVIPPQANFDRPNPELKLDDSPFFVPARISEWPGTRRAGVSSFGVGGTNAHVILQQAPSVDRATPERRWQLLPLSARTRTAVDAAADRLARHLDERPDLPLADVAFTLQSGRRQFGVRRFAVAADAAGAAAALRAVPHRSVTKPQDPQRVVFMFPGGGSQHPDMALEIYRNEPVFAEHIDRCADLLPFDLRRFLFPSAFAGPIDRDSPPIVLAGIFSTSYALARLWQAWGVQPVALLGHSLGEYVAACLAGVFSLPDALDLTVRRGEMFARMPAGRMLSVTLAEDEVRSLLGERLSLAAVNGPELTLVSGPADDIEELAGRLAARDVEHRLVRINVASHSWMVEPYLGEFAAAVSSYRLAEPEMPVLSGVTGTWLTPADAVDPGYWARHLRQPVRFADCLREAAASPNTVLLESGPGRTLTVLAAGRATAVASLPHPRDRQPELAHLLDAAGRLWQAGVDLDWTALSDPAARRTPLPTYPFERQRHWIPPGHLPETAESAESAEDGPAELSDDFEPPAGEHEAMVAELWRDLLGVDRISRHDDFAALGGHSLTAAYLVRKLQKATGVRVTVQDVFARPTVAMLAALVAGDNEIAEVDLVAEAVLDPAIRPAGGAHERPARPRKVLLTGATGFLGSYLCAELLRQTDAEVLCLVRNVDRLRAKLGSSFDRVTVVPGDLAKPNLGLDDFAGLGAELDAIYHCGAWVNFVRPYQALKATNVLGTQEILRLAVTGGLTPVHHVSTLAVLAGAVVAGVPEVPESAELPDPVGHDTAYTQSKWVAERLVQLAVERGVPVAVYRPGLILGDSRTGVSNADDYLTAIIAGCVRLGVAPLREYPQAVGTVDDVARTIVALSLRPDSIGKVCHPIDPEPLQWNRIFDEIRAAGYPVTSVGFAEWRAAAADDDGLAPLADLLASAAADRPMPRFGTANVTAGLAGTGITRTALDAGYFGTVLDYFTRAGWLPSATGRKAP